MNCLNSVWHSLQWLEPGVVHRRRGEPCQDVLQNYKRKGVYGHALSDGASSCLYAQEAAKESCGVALRWLVNNFGYLKQTPLHLLRDQLFLRLYKRLDSKARRYKSILEEWGCTLLVLVHDDEDYVVVHIGDGIIAKRAYNGELRAISLPENGVQNNVTYFLTSKDARKHMRVYRGKVHEIESFVLMSDGVTEAFWFEGADAFAPALYSFLDWISEDKNKQSVWQDIHRGIVDVVQQISSDDCALMVVYRGGAL